MILLGATFVLLLLLLLVLAHVLPPAHTDWYAFDIRERHRARR
jgi:hypothetical protein